MGVGVGFGMFAGLVFWEDGVSAPGASHSSACSVLLQGTLTTMLALWEARKHDRQRPFMMTFRSISEVGHDGILTG